MKTALHIRLLHLPRFMIWLSTLICAFLFSLTASNSAYAADLTWTNDQGDFEWGDFSDSTSGNWTDGYMSLLAFYNGFSVEFTDAGSGSINVVGTVSVPYMIFSNMTTDFTVNNNAITASGTMLFSGDGNVTIGTNLLGTASLSKTGAGTLTLSGANTYSGGTNLNAGRITVGNNAALGTGALNMADGTTLGFSGNHTVANNIALTGTGNFDTGGNSAELSGIISGTGSLTKDGTGTLTLTGANTYSGLTSVNAGTLTLTVAGTISNSLALHNTAVFDFSAIGSSPQALKNLSVYGQGSTINAGSNTADFTNGSLNFFIPATATSGTPLLNVTGDADITGANVSMVYQTVRPTIGVGQSLTLLDVSGTLTGTESDLVSLTVQTANGDIYTLNVNNDALLAVLTYISPTTPAYERLKAYAGSRAANFAFVNQGQDLLLNQGFGSALAATSGQGFRMNAFGGMGGGWSRYNTGSHVDVEGFSMLVGLALGNDAGPGRITLGAFFEGGWGSYDSHNSFSNHASVKGDGDTEYLGGGVLGRYDLTSGALSGLYFDASARMGRTKADFGTDDITYNGNEADFDTSSLYYGLHGGIGYVWSINEAASLDLSAKLLWTHQDGDSVNAHGDKVRFKDTDSLRTRLGGRFSYAVNEHFTPYVGAYWEHEFDGETRSTVNSNGIDAPTLEGSTGMGELGLSFKPVAGSGFSLDLGVQGYTGAREGVSGSFQVKFEF